MATRRCAVESVENAKLAVGVYTGRLVNNKRDGRGKLTWQGPGGQHTYDGDWRDGLKHGRGTYTWPDGVTYDGEWNNNKFDGWESAAAKLNQAAAVMVTVYEGWWNNGQRHGHGMWRSPETGTIYCGEWDHDVMSGTARMLIGDNSTLHHDPGGSYVGERKNDEFHGEGVRLWSNGDRYQGDWVDGKEHGNGTKRWARDGSSFTGVWERGAPVKGTMECPNEVSEQRDGEVRRYSGEGVMTLSPSPSEFQLIHSDGLKGILQGNMFHGTDGILSHVMGSSLPQLGHSKLIKELQTKQKEEEEGADELSAVHDIAHETSQRQSEALSELNTAFKVATKLRSQLKKAAPLLVSLEESVSTQQKFLQRATETNQALDVHLRDLTALRESLEKVVGECDRRCKEILGETLTVESNLKNLITLRRWLLLPDVNPTTTLLCCIIWFTAERDHRRVPFTATLFQRLHDEIDSLCAKCRDLKEAYKRKYMVMRGLEALPVDPRAQHLLVNFTFLKYGSKGTWSQQQGAPPFSTAGTSSNFECIVCTECDERPCSIRFHPCEHSVCYEVETSHPNIIK
ncbi:2-isopropylmalate synthase [Pelomyxa schiedti]|nr:2-isopropylmalate synthase [Pelomyxa schiedti]